MVDGPISWPEGIPSKLRWRVVQAQEDRLPRKALNEVVRRLKAAREQPQGQIVVRMQQAAKKRQRFECSSKTLAEALNDGVPEQVLRSVHFMRAGIADEDRIVPGNIPGPVEIGEITILADAKGTMLGIRVTFLREADWGDREARYLTLAATGTPLEDSGWVAPRVASNPGT